MIRRNVRMAKWITGLSLIVLLLLMMACDRSNTPPTPIFPERPAPTPNLLRVQQENSPTRTCHPSYESGCLLTTASDYDCRGGEGDGPLYTGRVRVVGPDVFGLDRDGDGIGCE